MTNSEQRRLTNWRLKVHGPLRRAGAGSQASNIRPASTGAGRRNVTTIDSARSADVAVSAALIDRCLVEGNQPGWPIEGRGSKMQARGAIGPFEHEREPPSPVKSADNCSLPGIAHVHWRRYIQEVALPVFLARAASLAAGTSILCARHAGVIEKGKTGAAISGDFGCGIWRVGGDALPPGLVQDRRGGDAPLPATPTAAAQPVRVKSESGVDLHLYDRVGQASRRSVRRHQLVPLAGNLASADLCAERYFSFWPSLPEPMRK
jgi:hypothetical protein